MYNDKKVGSGKISSNAINAYHLQKITSKYVLGSKSWYLHCICHITSIFAMSLEFLNLFFDIR